MCPKLISKRSKIKLDSLLLALFIFSFGMVFSVTSVLLDIKIIKVWKELFIILIFLFSILDVFLRKENNKKRVYSLIYFLAIPLIYFLVFPYTNIILPIYQFKIDILPFLIPFSVFLIIRNYNEWSYFTKRILRLIVYSALINSFFVCIQSIFTDQLLGLLQLEDYYNNSGGDIGMRLDSTESGLRAMGLTNGFGVAGSLILLAIFILMECNIFSYKKRILFIPFLILAMILTTYKTTMIGISIYFIYKAFSFWIKNNMSRKIFILVISIISFFTMAFLSNSNFLYDKYYNTQYKDIIYNSVYIRTLQHDSILNDLIDQDKLFLGVGIGTNGTSGPDQSLKMNSKALDSLYINILSNYGLVTLILFIFFCIILLIYFSRLNFVLSNLSCLIIFFVLGVEFFFNNTFSSFPVNIYFSTIVLLALMYKDDFYLRNKYDT